jgi:hypothetical protein
MYPLLIPVLILNLTYPWLIHLLLSSNNLAYTDFGKFQISCPFLAAKISSKHLSNPEVLCKHFVTRDIICGEFLVHRPTKMLAYHPLRTARAAYYLSRYNN